VSEASLPLGSVRITDLTQAWAGPFATRLLADLGAEVIKIESASHPDVLRLWAPPAGIEGPTYDMNPWFNSCNANKLSVSLDLDSEAGRDILRQLVAISDVVIDNFSARVMTNLGFDYQALRQIKEDIIVLSMPAYGCSGPYKNYVGYGEAVESIGGLTMLTGYPDKPIRLGIALVDVLASFNAAAAIIAALIQRKRGGCGQFIDLSHFEACGRGIGQELIAYQFTKEQPPRIANRHRLYAPQGCYPCTGDDEWVVISVQSDEQWRALAGLIGSADLMDDASLATADGRLAQHDRIDREIARWTRACNKYEAMRACQAAGIPAAVVSKPEDVINDPHLRARGFLEEVEHPVAGRSRVEGPAFKLSKTPLRVQLPAPAFGQHTDYVLKDLLGKSDEEVASLREQGVVGRLIEFDSTPRSLSI
jgi:crotonobetainyl-CoA:carnitine CoA-transferase CaiB-like acyl-CoA transferase